MCRMDAQRGAVIGRRAERLGISVRELAQQAGVSRGAASRAVAGEEVRPATLGQLEAALDRLEAEIDGERMDRRDRIGRVNRPAGRNTGDL